MLIQLLANAVFFTGLTVWVFAGMLALAWIVEFACDRIYRKLHCSADFIRFLVWRSHQDAIEEQNREDHYLM